jgi:hypothetical protein
MAMPAAQSRTAAMIARRHQLGRRGNAINAPVMVATRISTPSVTARPR